VAGSVVTYFEKIFPFKEWVTQRFKIHNASEEFGSLIALLRCAILSSCVTFSHSYLQRNCKVGINWIGRRFGHSPLAEDQVE
jgi:hypothetical protein